ncbi:MAG: Asp-tRNA(Asn)/Glu-tRNA(Gln) amidotransferase subunit GatC [Caldilineales bacterium]|nr:Asp-tRNA(Asn)/Glu-tRNA(Gln) amidotransferase subunit GatC [Caldilineales bacterium]
MTALSADVVRHVAELTKIHLTAAEIERFADQLSAVLAYADQLQEIDTDHIPVTAAAPLYNVMRADEVQPSLPLADVLANAPDHDGHAFRVHAVLVD